LFSIISSQLRFKPLPLSAYEIITPVIAWIMIILSIAIDVAKYFFHGHNSSMITIVAVFTLIFPYLWYRVMGWWLYKQNLWDKSGHLWGLIAIIWVSGTIIGSLLTSLHSLYISYIFGILWLLIFFNALKTALHLSTRKTIEAMVLSYLGGSLIGSVLFIMIFLFIEGILGVSIPMPK